MDTEVFLLGLEPAITAEEMISRPTAFVEGLWLAKLLPSVLIARSEPFWDDRAFQPQLDDKRLLHANDK